MALKMPVIDIPLDDSKFRRFSELFQQYGDRLEKTPGVWQKVDKAFRATTAAMLAQNQAMREFGGGDKAQQRGQQFWLGIAVASRATLGNVLHISRELMKWGTLIGGGLVGGSLFGIDRMAGSLAASRFGYLGLGMNFGSSRSFGINMSRFTDPGSFLAQINQAISNPALQGPLYAMGVDPNGSTEQVSLAMLRAMRRLAVNTPRSLLGTMSDAFGLGSFGGLETLMRLRRIPAEEFYKQMRREGADRNALNLPPDVARKWTDFTNQMELAKSSIFKTFVVGLEPLEEPLERLSVAFSGFLSKVMSGPELKKGIDNLATMLNEFSTPRFLKAMRDFTGDIEGIARALNRVTGNEAMGGATGAAIGGLFAGPLGAAVGGAYGVTAGDVYGMYESAKWRRNFLQHPTLGAFNAAASQLDALFGLPAGLLEAVKLQESGGMLSGVPKSSAGAMGVMQLMPATARMLGVNPNDSLESLYGAGEYLSSLIRHYHGNVQEALAAYNLGPEKFDRRYGGSLSRLPRSVRSYVTAIAPDSNIVVTAKHKTGGNPVLSANSLAGIPQ